MKYWAPHEYKETPLAHPTVKACKWKSEFAMRLYHALSILPDADSQRVRYTCTSLRLWNRLACHARVVADGSLLLSL
jgi:hypothetical protein